MPVEKRKYAQARNTKSKRSTTMPDHIGDPPFRRFRRAYQPDALRSIPADANLGMLA